MKKVPTSNIQDNKTGNITEGRYKFLDLYRSIIILFMLEGHIFRELLHPAIKSTQIFVTHEILHGITAPGFLFGAGFAFQIAAQRRWNEVTTLTPGFFKRLWRAVMLILIGYILHLPYLSLSKTISLATPQQWNEFLRFDVLQCIGCGLLVMRLILVIVRKEKIITSIIMFLLLLIVYLTPFFWKKDFVSVLPYFIVPALNGLTGSMFPLFPFVGFLFAGSCVSYFFLRYSRNNRSGSFINRLLLCGLILIGLGYVSEYLKIQLFTESSFWYTSPNYFWIRLGILFILISLFWYVEKILTSKNKQNIFSARWMLVLGMESLFVYIVHLLILYGWAINSELNLSFFWKNKLGSIDAIFVLIIFTITMVLLSYFWHYLKKKHPILSKGILWWIGISIGWSILISSY